LDDGQLVILLYKPLDGFDVFAFSLESRIEAGIDGETVDKDRTGSALSFPASLLGACHVQGAAEKIEQRLVAVRQDIHGGSVQDEAEILFHFRS
jgi:hypothetical protein